MSQQQKESAIFPVFSLSIAKTRGETTRLIHECRASFIF